MPDEAAAREMRVPTSLGPVDGSAIPAAAARLQAIHDLVRSGDYHVPAAVIADRMVEQMIAARRRLKY
jgi:hypothetical protein